MYRNLQPLLLLVLSSLLVLGGLVAMRTPTQAQTTTTIHIQNFAFVPPSLTVAAGSTVTWVNDDATTHTSTADAGQWDSGPIASGQSYSHVFSQAGTFTYHCAIHPFMTATLVVQGAGSTPTATPVVPPPPAATAIPTATAAVPLPPTATAQPTSTSTATVSAPTAVPTKAPSLRTLRVSIKGKLVKGKASALTVSVHRAPSGPAVGGASVSLNATKVGVSRLVRAKTNSQGVAKLSLKPQRAGTAQLSVTKSGYHTKKVSLRAR
ncbi:MAG TPA: cupredoxin family copper-binding protein [Chloroflexota bacterium]